MAMFYIRRNNQDFGPYDEQSLKTYVDNGQILLCDEARNASTGEINSVKSFLKRAHVKTKVKSTGTLGSQLKDIGGELIFPKNTILSKQWTKDKALIVLAFVGLMPSVLMFFPLGQVVSRADKPAGESVSLRCAVGAVVILHFHTSWMA